MKELSLNVLDIAQNAVKAGARHIDITVERTGGQLAVTIADDGCGMTKEFLAAVTDPFTTTRTTRKVGMGIPLFKLAAEQTGGTFSIASVADDGRGNAHGTTVRAVIDTAHVDCAPMGDMASTMVALIQGSPDIAWTYRSVTDGEELTLSTEQMREMLGPEVPLDAPEVLGWVRDFLTQQAE